MTRREYHPGKLLLLIALFLLLFLCYGLGLFTIPALHANPMLLLPFLVTFSMFAEEVPAAFTGLAVGIFTDSISATASVFHTLLFCAIGLSVSLAVHFLLNNNLRAALLLSLLCSLLYYLLRWLLFSAFETALSDSVVSLLRFSLPSLIYTNLFLFPFYYLHRALARKG